MGSPMRRLVSTAPGSSRRARTKPPGFGMRPRASWSFSFDHGDGVNTATFSPGGARIRTASLDKTAKLWDAASGKPIASFVHEANVYHVAFSPDGARILTASADNTAKLWDATSGKLIASFDHQDNVRWAAF